MEKQAMRVLEKPIELYFVMGKTSLFQHPNTPSLQYPSTPFLLHRYDQRQHHRSAFERMIKESPQGLADLFLDVGPIFVILLLPEV